MLQVAMLDFASGGLIILQVAIALSQRFCFVLQVLYPWHSSVAVQDYLRQWQPQHCPAALAYIFSSP